MLRSRFARRSFAWGAALALVGFVLLGAVHHHDSPDPGSNTCQLCKLTTAGVALPDIEASAGSPVPEASFLASETAAVRDAGHHHLSPARAPPVPANA